MRGILVRLIAAGIIAGAASADMTSDGKFAAGLRERGLVDFAADHCRGQLKKADLSAARRAECTIELCRALAAQAADAAPTERAALWKEARDAVERFAARHRDDPRLLHVRMQAAMTVTVRGELALREVEVSTSAVALAEARPALTEANRELEKLAGDVAVALRRVDRPGAPPGDARQRVELMTLESDVRRAYARSQQLLAECFAAGSPDRVDALTQAIDRLKPLAASDDAQEAIGARLELAFCYRLLGDYENARGQIDAVARDPQHAPLADRLATEAGRLAMAERRWKDAAAALGEAGTSAAPPSSAPAERRYAAADRQFARLELALGQWEAATASNDAEASKLHVGRAAEIARALESHGPYWQRRARTLLGSRLAGKTGGGDLAVLVTAAENLVHADRL
ncbi:MAG: hypothetical protein WD176_05235, partial [Pirellulales bacterium]